MLDSPRAATGDERIQASEAHGASSGYHYGLGCLRAFVVVLVVAHHALFAYNPVPPRSGKSLVEEPRWWRSFPILDDDRFTGALLFNTFTDLFFMSLMFFVSGLFVWSSLRRKGCAAFVRDRARRLGIPFVVAALVVAPLGYYPAYLAMAPEPSIADFIRQWLSLGEWPAGPAWFIWVLLLFSALAALLTRRHPHWAPAVGRIFGPWLREPSRFMVALIAISAAMYVPLSLLVGAADWTIFGPFAFQTARLPHYALYFAAGIVVGATGLENGLFGSQAKLASRWPIWVAGAGCAYLLYVVVSGSGWVEDELVAAAIRAVLYTVSCAASSLALVAVFLRFTRWRGPLWTSLRDNAYGIYLIHLPFSSWTQYLLLGAAIPVAVKAAAAFGAALVFSWIASILLRRVPAVARVV